MSENMEEKSIYLGYPLDLLMNRECSLDDYTLDPRKGTVNPGAIGKKRGGIILPTDSSAGTGNIVIKGRPGTGKSTLALQIAITCTLKENNYIAAYIPLEENVNNIYNKAQMFHWEENLLPICHLHDVEESSDPQALADHLRMILTQPGQCPIKTDRRSTNGNIHCDLENQHVSSRGVKPRVLVPSLSPRGLRATETEGHALFWERYRQLEKLITAAKALREQKDPGPPVPEFCVICIDNLNVFGDKSLSREEVFSIFDLFKRNRMIGVFIIEEGGDQPGLCENVMDTDAVEYMADMVISLNVQEDKGYFMRYLEIEKSRYQHQVYGKHPYKTKSGPFEKRDRKTEFLRTMMIFPSLHYLVGKTEIKKNAQNGKEFDFCIKGFDRIIKKGLTRGSVVTIEGPSSTFKSHLARNFLLRGLCKGENVLLVRLSDRTSFKACSSLSAELQEDFKWEHLRNTGKCAYVSGDDYIKVAGNEWIYQSDGGKKSRLIELAFKSGALLPEEIVQKVYQVLKDNEKGKGNRIRRVVLRDVSLIGVSYPFLKSSRTAGDLFLSSFVHLMRNCGVDLVMVGSTGELEETNDAVSRACALADAILSCKLYDVFGDRHVVVMGDGLTAGAEGERDHRELAPGVIRIDHTVEPKVVIKGEKVYRYAQPFRVDTDYLKGLVGFGTERIYRPGLSLYIFQESEIFKEYNVEIANLLNYAFASPPVRKAGSMNNPQNANVNVFSFNNKMVESVQDSLGVLGGMPVDRTVVCTVDEFWVSAAGDYHSLEDITPSIEKDVKGDKFLVSLDSNRLRAMPYYANVLLLAYRKDIADSLGAQEKKKLNELLPSVDFKEVFHRFRSWDHVRKFAALLKEASVSGVSLSFDYDKSASETFSCVLMDALISGYELAMDRQGDGILSDALLDKEIAKMTFTDGKESADCTLLHRIDEQRGDKVYKIIAGQFHESKKIAEETIKELKVLQSLLLETEKDLKEINSDVPNGTGELHPDAAVYLCWYSQLREFLIRNPDLCDKIDICALPGRGFRGDWFLGIVSGSVSINLGLKVMDILCSETEEYKRFLRGVGLPTRKSFYTVSKRNGPDFFAWPYSGQSLNKVLEIHRQALVRSSIPDYKRFKPVLTNFCRRIAGKEYDPDLLKSLIERLPHQIKVLKGNGR